MFRGNDVSYSLEITLEQAVNGAKTDIRVPVWEECKSCHGTGCKPGTSKKPCSHCGGSGTININRGFLQVQQTCPYCHGTGEVISDPCPDCQGVGRVRQTKTLEVNIPAGINHGQRIRIQGRGEPGLNGGPNGDLYVQVLIKPHDIFQRDGDDLHADLPIGFATAALGGEVAVPTMDTEARITIPEGTQTGKIFRLRGKGVPNLHTKQKGDLYVHVFVETPVNLSAKQKKLLKDFDASSKWVMQAWSLREPIVKAVPREDLIILDLNGSKVYERDGFWGYPAVEGNLHNFGGRINLHGDLRLLASNQYMAAWKAYPNICGSGLFMESIEQNPVYYDLAFEMPLHQDTVCIEEWLKFYADRRYGARSEFARQAMLCLLEGPYRPGTNGTERSSIIAARPALDVKKSGPNAGLGIPYPPALLIEAEGFLLSDAERLQHSAPYRFDVVDVQRQLMSNLGQAIHRKAAEAFRKGDKAAFALHSGRFLQLLADVDELLRTRPEFNFDRWLLSARSWGETEEEKDLLERDATSLVTVWGGDGDPVIFDYSWREWVGRNFMPCCSNALTKEWLIRKKVCP